MKRRYPLSVWCATFMAALGLNAASCGVEDASDPNNDVTSSSSSSGSSSSGMTSGGDASSSGSSGGDASSGGDVSSGSSGGPPAFPCENPEPIVVDGVDTGFERCDGGFTHRDTVVDCPSSVPRENTMCESLDPQSSSCVADADCTDSANGHCEQDPFVGACWCSYGCTSDDDCGPGQLCLCGDPVGQCVQADCTTDADCGEGMLCTTYVQSPGCGGTAFACQTAADECGGSVDCVDDQECSHDGMTHYCQEPNCVVGRPFLIEGVERTAAIAARDDWSADATTPAEFACSDALRERLCEHWSWIGLMEHASIAAFARSAMQLMSLGAPPELLIETTAAMGDETEHARLCFALASAYGRRPIGPGPLEIEGALEEDSFEEILAMVIREGCIGETVAALEAREALEHVIDPTVREVLERIADDERRHALLAWRTIRWVLEGCDAARSAWIRREFSVARAELMGRNHSAPEAFDDALLLAHGVVSDAVRDGLRRDVLDQIIMPCLDALLDGSNTTARALRV